MLCGFDGKTPRIGSETYVSHTALVVGDVTIGDNCYIGHGAILRGDYGTIQIGNATAVEEGVIIHAPPERTCVIADKVTIGHGAIVHCKSIGNYALIGMGAILSLCSEIGDETVIAEGSVVRWGQKVPGGVVAGGNPAEFIRHVSQEEKSSWEWAKQLYIDLARKYLDSGMPRID